MKKFFNKLVGGVVLLMQPRHLVILLREKVFQRVIWLDKVSPSLIIISRVSRCLQNLTLLQLILNASWLWFKASLRQLKHFCTPFDSGPEGPHRKTDNWKNRSDKGHCKGLCLLFVCFFCCLKTLRWRGQTCGERNVCRLNWFQWRGKWGKLERKSQRMEKEEA